MTIATTRHQLRKARAAGDRAKVAQIASGCRDEAARLRAQAVECDADGRMEGGRARRAVAEQWDEVAREAGRAIRDHAGGGR